MTEPTGQIKIDHVGATVEIGLLGAAPGDNMRVILTPAQAKKAATALYWAAAQAELAAQAAADKAAADATAKAARLRAEADKLDGSAT